MTDLQEYLDKALANVKIDFVTEETVPYDYDLNKEICDLIISSRMVLGITQKQLAEKSGVSQANISKIENGKYIPSIPVLKRIAAALGKRICIDFLNFEEDE